MLLFLSFVIATVFFLSFAWKLKQHKFCEIQSAPCVPVLGTSLYFEREGYKFFRQIRNWSKEKKIYVMWFFFHPLLWIGEIESAEIILKSQEILSKSFIYNFLHPWLGTGLLTSTHQKWKSRRRALTPSFHFNILNQFESVFLKQAKIMVKKLQAYASNGESFDAQVPVSLATLDIICETAMGVSANAQNKHDSEYVNAINAVNKIIQRRQKAPWLWPDFIYWTTSEGKIFKEKLNILHSFTTDVINNKIQARKTNKENDGDGTKAFMDMLLDLYEKDKIDIDGIREEVDTFMFEGHDTTAAGLSWTLYMLGLNPEIQKKLHNEIDQANVDDDDGGDTNVVEKIKGLKYLEYVMKEGLRLHPPVAAFGRTLEKDEVIKGVSIPKGTDVVIDVLALHTDPLHWDDPLKFNPDRFSEEKFAKRNAYCYVPFSAGPRNCIGQKFAMLEEKVLLYHIMLNFEIEATQKESDILGSFELIHKSSNGLLIKLKSRK